MSDTKALDAAQRVVAVCDTLADITREGFDDFTADVRTQWAVEMGLIRVGEGVNCFPTDVMTRFGGQPWREIIGLRDFVAYQHDDLNLLRVWRTVTRDVPALRVYLADTVIAGLR